MKTPNASFIEKAGPVGMILAVFSCPVCFPVFAIAGTALGMGVFQPFEGTLFLIFRILVVIATIGHIVAYFHHRRLLPLLIGIISPILIFLSLYLYPNKPLLYLGLVGLFIASPLNFLVRKEIDPEPVE